MKGEAEFDDYPIVFSQWGNKMMLCGRGGVETDVCQDMPRTSVVGLCDQNYFISVPSMVQVLFLQPVLIDHYSVRLAFNGYGESPSYRMSTMLLNLRYPFSNFVSFDRSTA